MKVAVIGDRTMVIGFGLLGVKDAKIAERPQDVEEYVRGFLGDTEIGVILLQDHLAEEIRAFLTGIQKEKRVYPIIVEIPGKGGPIEREDPIQKTVKRAVGIDISRRGMSS
jgi:vacuolar-type H+-ATPase subunit F/Vma7